MPNFEPEFYPETDDHTVVIPQGFASPSEDDLDVPLNLHKYVVRHPAATFFVRMTGSIMESHGIFDGDILVIDRSLIPKIESIVMAVIDGEFVVRVYGDITKEGEVWGVVTFSIKDYKGLSLRGTTGDAAIS
jgi:DNA polymerase V